MGRHLEGVSSICQPALNYRPQFCDTETFSRVQCHTMSILWQPVAKRSVSRGLEMTKLVVNSSQKAFSDAVPSNDDMMEKFTALKKEATKRQKERNEALLKDSMKRDRATKLVKEYRTSIDCPNDERMVHYADVGNLSARRRIDQPYQAASRVTPQKF